MEKIKEIVWTHKFEQDFKKIRDRATQAYKPGKRF